VVTGQQWELRRRPSGYPVPEDVALVEAQVPGPQPGQLLVRNHYLSVDPSHRGRMNDVKSYTPAYQIGQALWGGAVGEVLASEDARIPVGAFVQHNLGWRTHSVVDASTVDVVDPAVGGLAAYLGVLGMPGLTAWVGLYDIGQLRPGEVVWVSAATGAVGSLAGQLARLAGCRVVGSAGGDEKCRYAVEQLGFDACVDHRAGDLNGQLREVLPDGLDVYFDNVGGSHLRAAIDLANPFARLVECGMIEGYNEAMQPVDNLASIVGKKLSIRGFVVWDHWSRLALFRKHVGGLLTSGAVHYDETVVVGIEHQLDALLTLLRGGGHRGKLVVDVRP
jgi:NADPH-dependent curcumin reductase CurA